MASLSFSYRSKKKEAPLEVRLSYRTQGNPNPISFYGRSKIVVEKSYWKRHYKNVKDINDQEKQAEINTKITDLRKFVLSAFEDTDPAKISKTWLKNQIERYYKPIIEVEIPNDLINFMDFYLERKQRDLSEVRIKRIKVTKNKLKRFEKSISKQILIKEVNDDFKKDYSRYCDSNLYSQNTQQTEISIIKTICLYAQYSGLEVSPQLKSLRLKPEIVDSIYLTPDEILKIKKLDLPNDRLENARDWLLISCHTGQRVSDFLRFNTKMIRIEKGKHLLEFRQKKTGKLITIPFGREAREVLEKRNGEFPREISDQKYNDYIKEVCKLAGLKQKTKGKIINCIAEEGVKPTRNDYRKITGTFEKWELVTSHIGRRSFATNNYGRVPTSYLRKITGHGTEKMFLNYIKKSNKDTALDAYDYFE